MSIEIWRSQYLYQTTVSPSTECFNDDKMQLVIYTLGNKESINISPDDYEVTSTIIVDEGKLHIHSSHNVYEINTHDIILLKNIDESYYAEAEGFTRIIVVTSEANQDTSEDAAVNNMLTIVEEKDVYTVGHSRRVSLYAKRLALAYESTYNVVSLSAAATMHDVGKINTSADILRKPTKLTEEEFNIIKKHPADSYEILKDTLGERIALAARHHHERLDGSGYPDGLKGDQISMDARIIAIADVFDAMTCKRIYNEPSLPLQVVEYLESNQDKYDQRIIAILRRKVENGDLDDILTAFIK